MCMTRNNAMCVLRTIKAEANMKGKKMGCFRVSSNRNSCSSKSTLLRAAAKLEPANSRRLHYSVTAWENDMCFNKSPLLASEAQLNAMCSAESLKGPLTQREDASRVPWGPVETWLRA